MKIEIESKHLSALGALVYAKQDEVNAKNFSAWLNNMFENIRYSVDCDDCRNCKTCPKNSQCDVLYYFNIGIDYINNGGPEEQALMYLRGEVDW